MFPHAFKWMKLFFKKDDGLTAIEYGMAAAFIAVVVIGSLTTIAPEINRHLGNTFEPNAGVIDACGKVNPQGKCTAVKAKGKGGSKNS